MTMLVHHRKGILALLSSSITSKTSCAFSSSSINKNPSIRRQSSSRISNIIAKSTTKDDSDPSLANDNDYEWLKASRPMRIYARPLPLDYGDGNDDIGSSSTSGTKKIVHFQRHGMILCCAYYNVYCFENLNLTSLIQSIYNRTGNT